MLNPNRLTVHRAVRGAMYAVPPIATHNPPDPQDEENDKQNTIIAVIIAFIIVICLI